MPLSVAQLLENWDLVERARQKGARILPPTGALIGLDAVRAAAEGDIRSVTMITRKPPGGLEGAPYLLEHNISVANLKAPLKVFDGSARAGSRGSSATHRGSASSRRPGSPPRDSLRAPRTTTSWPRRNAASEDPALADRPGRRSGQCRWRVRDRVRGA